MTRSPGWSTLNIVTPLYSEIKNIAAQQGLSASAWANHWLRIGVTVDTALASVDDKSTVLGRLLEALARIEAAES